MTGVQTCALPISEALRREKDREKRQKDELDDEEAYNEAINAARERDIAVLGILKYSLI